MAQDITTLFGKLRRGRAIPAFDKALGDVLDACAATGKPGVMQVAITVTPGGRDEDGKVVSWEFNDKLTTKLPLAPTGTTILFRDAEGHLTDRDARQPELPTIGRDGREAANG